MSLMLCLICSSGNIFFTVNTDDDTTWTPYGSPVGAIVSVRLLSFYFGGSKLVRFLAKIEHTPRKLLYFVNRPYARSSKSAKIVPSKSNFYVRKQRNFFNFFNSFKNIFFFFSKIMPNFCRLSIRSIHKIQ